MARRRSREPIKQADGWTRVPVSSVAAVNPQTLVNADNDPTVVPHFAMAQLDEFRGSLRSPELLPYEKCRSGKSKFVDGDVLFAKITPCVENGKSGLVMGLDGHTGFGSSEFYVLRSSRRVLQEYLFYFVRQRSVVQAAVDSFTGTSGRQRVPRGFWDQLEIPLPPLPIQERIVQILRKADEIRRKRQNALELADATLAATFIRMFGNPIDNPKGFEPRPLGELAEIRAGVTKGRKLGDKEVVEVPYLRVANVQDGYLDLAEVKTIEVLPGDVERYRLELGDVLMIEGCGNPNYLGRGCMWNGEIEGCIHQNHVFRVRADRSLLCPEYLASLLRTRYANEYFRRCAKNSSGLANINSTQVKAFEVPHAPLDLQKQFVAAVEKWKEMAVRLTTARKDASDTLKSLLKRAFAGELTAAWEATHREVIAEEQELHARLPQLVLLGFLNEHTKRVAQGAAAVDLWLTALMKYAFLLQMEGAAKAQLYRFVPYHYGPFAKEVYTDLEALREQGLIAVESKGDQEPDCEVDGGGLLRVAEAIAPYGSKRPRRVEAPRIDITIVDPEGVDSALEDVPAGMREDISAVLDTYGDLAHNALLDAVYEKYPAFAKKSRLRKTSNKRSGRRRGGPRSRSS